MILVQHTFRQYRGHSSFMSDMTSFEMKVVHYHPDVGEIARKRLFLFSFQDSLSPRMPRHLDLLFGVKGQNLLERSLGHQDKSETWQPTGHHVAKPFF